jgi:threonylcarbamoyladenosine tRNA methylthiotransferase MtaB
MDRRIKKVALTTLGCKANFADSEFIRSLLMRSGVEVCRFDDMADVYVVNTCTVTHVAEQQSRQMLRKAKRKNPKAKVVAFGCAGEASRDAFASIPEVDSVFGTSDMAALAKHLIQICGAVDRSAGDGPYAMQSRARAFLKIQDGCGRSCAYCIVPRARGRARSMPADEIVRACDELSKYHREIILTGVDISQYRADGGRTRLADVVERLLNGEGDFRIRLSSLSPEVVDERLISLIAGSKRVCRHVHLSIQSLSDPILALMGRGYTGDGVRAVADALVKSVPGVAVTGDMIVGLPGEGERDFSESLKMFESMPMAGLHVFPFSERSGTKAAAMDGKVDVHTIKERARVMRDAARSKREAFLMAQRGLSLDVIVVSKEADEDGLVEAVSDNAISIFLPDEGREYGQMYRAGIDRISGTRAFGIWH